MVFENGLKYPKLNGFLVDEPRFRYRSKIGCRVDDATIFRGFSELIEYRTNSFAGLCVVLVGRGVVNVVVVLVLKMVVLAVAVRVGDGVGGFSVSLDVGGGSVVVIGGNVYSLGGGGGGKVVVIGGNEYSLDGGGGGGVVVGIGGNEYGLGGGGSVVVKYAAYVGFMVGGAVCGWP